MLKFCTTNKIFVYSQLTFFFFSPIEDRFPKLNLTHTQSLSFLIYLSRKYLCFFDIVLALFSGFYPFL